MQRYVIQASPNHTPRFLGSQSARRGERKRTGTAASARWTHSFFPNPSTTSRNVRFLSIYSTLNAAKPSESTQSRDTEVRPRQQSIDLTDAARKRFCPVAEFDGSRRLARMRVRPGSTCHFYLAISLDQGMPMYAVVSVVPIVLECTSDIVKYDVLIS